MHIQKRLHVVEIGREQFVHRRRALRRRRAGQQTEKAADRRLHPRRLEGLDHADRVLVAIVGKPGIGQRQFDRKQGIAQVAIALTTLLR
jgi:hypothetical protein